MPRRKSTWNPLREMLEMQRAMDRMFENTLPEIDNTPAQTGNLLAIDIDETDEVYIVETDIPGLKPEDITVDAEEKRLTISAEYPESRKPEGTRQVVRERMTGRFSRSIELPQPIDVEDVDASYEDGVLRLMLPKAEKVKPRQITVKANKLIETS